MQRLQPKARYSPTQDTPVFLLKEIANHDSKNTSSYTEDYVMVPAQFPSKTSKPHAVDIFYPHQHKDSEYLYFTAL